VVEGNLVSFLPLIPFPPRNVQTYAWVPNNGNLVITFGGPAIKSLYMNLVDVDIAFSAVPTPPNGNPFYTAVNCPNASNPQVIPVPRGTTQVTLAATSAETYYVVATDTRYRPSMEGPSQS
jgi:hypothetical protein